MNIMGSRIKELRTNKGLTQEDLAEILGVNRVNISHYESGKISNIPSDKLDLLANVFNTNVDYIMGRSNFQEKIDKEPSTIAAHHDGEDWTEEELQEIQRFKEFVRMRRKDNKE